MRRLLYRKPQSEASRPNRTDPPPSGSRTAWWNDPRLLGGAAALLALLFALRHHYARFDVETDFMGEYAPHARTILRGHLPESFPFRGPGYHLLLAFVGLVVRDLLWSGKLLSVAAFGLFVGLTVRAARHFYGAAAGLTAAFLVVAQPLVLLHGWSVGTDMLFAALSLLAICLLNPDGAAATGGTVPSARRLACAGAVAGYAWLTRPNGLFLLPAGLTALWLLASTGDKRRAPWRAWGIFGVAFFAPTLTWLAIYHMVHGHWPATLNYRNLAAAASIERETMSPDVYRRTFETEVQGYGAIIRDRGLTLLWRAVGNTPVYLGLMARDIFGPMVSVIAAAGLMAIAWQSRAVRRLRSQGRGGRKIEPGGAFWILPLAGAWAFLTLAPIYYEPRFGLFLAAPVAFLGTALLWRPTTLPGRRDSTMPPTAGHRRILLTAGTFLTAGVGLLMGIQLSRSELRNERVAIPAYRAGEALKARQDRGGVCARKPHVAFVADRSLVGFPDTPLESLADSLRARGTAYLFYGVIELDLLPQFAGLMRAETIPPGLQLIHMSPGIPFGLLFKVQPAAAQQPLSPEFKTALDAIRGQLERTGNWKRIEDRRAADSFQEATFLILRRRYPEAIQVLESVLVQDSARAEPHYYLGVALVETGRAAEGLRSLDKASSLGFESAELWLCKGRAHLVLKNFTEARRALDRALELKPQLGLARFFLAMEEAEAGRYDEAERLLAQSLSQGVAEDEGFMHGRARVLIMAHKLKQADSLLALARARYPNSADLRILSGASALEAGRFDEARRLFQEAGRIQPGDPRIELYLQSLPK